MGIGSRTNHGYQNLQIFRSSTDCDTNIYCAQWLSCVWVFVTPWTVAHQAPQSMEFSSKNTGVSSYSHLQGIFPTQESKLGLPHCRQILYPLRYLRSHHRSMKKCKHCSKEPDKLWKEADTNRKMLYDGWIHRSKDGTTVKWWTLLPRWDAGEGTVRGTLELSLEE